MAAHEYLSTSQAAKLPLQMTSCITVLSKGLRSQGCASAYPWQLLQNERRFWQGQLALSGSIPELSTGKCWFSYK